MSIRTKLSSTWPWEFAWIAFAFWIPNLSGLFLLYIAYPHVGKAAYWLLGLNIWGLLFAAVYTLVNKRVNEKKGLLKKKGLNPMDGLVSFGKMQAPAAIAITEETIYFAPVVGSELSYKLSKIKVTQIKASLPGKQFISKVAFHMTLENDAIFAFAVNIENAKIIKPFLIHQ